MSKVKITNVTKSKSPFYCGLSDNTSVALQYGQSMTVDETLLTDYVRGRQKVGVLKITSLPNLVEKTNGSVKKVNGGKKKTIENN